MLGSVEKVCFVYGAAQKSWIEWLGVVPGRVHAA
jgi:hypothetical protein